MTKVSLFILNTSFPDDGMSQGHHKQEKRHD